MPSPFGGTSGESPTGRGGVFIPPGQPQVAARLGDIVSPLADLAANAGAGTPGGWAYPQAQAAYRTYGANYPAIDLGMGAANDAFNFFQGIAFPQATGATTRLFGAGDQLLAAGGMGLPYASQMLGEGFDPRYGQLVDRAMGYGQRLAQGVGQVLDQAFDPQSALFNRTQQQLMDQTAVANAMAGLGGSPYGASVMGNTLGNFDINWQNQQLERQLAGLAGAGQGLSQAIGLPTGALNAREIAGVRGIEGLDQILSGMSGAYGQAGNLFNTGAGLNATAANQLAAFGAGPYNFSKGVGGDLLSGLNQTVTLGNQQFLLPQQVISDLMQYLGLGQSGSQIANAIGATNFNQLGQGIGGLGQLAFGANNMLGNPLGGLFGGGGGAAINGGLIDFGGGGAALGIPDVVAPATAGTDFLGALAPAALSV